MSSSTLILFAHPAFEKSRAHRALLSATTGLAHVTVNDLYENYPNFQIDVAREQQLLADHERIVIQHPLYWYSTPAIIKEWFDTVLQYGWAYGKNARALHGKSATIVTTTGGGEDTYGPDGYNHYTLPELLRPIEQTAKLCGLRFEDPLIFFGALHCDESGLAAWASTYRTWLHRDLD
jgi:glutathione-regulated potassium-efflux system ancillary protein KefG